jgi:hypothetical protein
LHKKFLSLAQISHAKPQRRKALPRFNSFLCVFAPLRGNLSLAKVISNTFCAKPIQQECDMRQRAHNVKLVAPFPNVST